MELELAPGEHVVSIQHDGNTARQTLQLGPDEERTVELTVGGRAGGGSNLTPAFWGFLGGAVVLAGGATATTVMAVPLGREVRDVLNQRDGTMRPPGFDDDVRRHNRLVIASWTMGGLAVASLASAFIFGRRSDEAAVSAVVSPSFSGVRVRLTW